MAFHKMPSGHFAYVINESGNRQLVTQDQFEDCCCPAPCACPCVGTWPPSEWPCGELLETYVISSFMFQYGTNFAIRTKSPIPISPGASSCKWTKVTTSLESTTDGGDTWKDTGGQFTVSIVNCAWRISLSAGFLAWSIDKGVGQTPVGSYSENPLTSSGSPVTWAASIS
jgi:hypothetical protein